MQAPRWFVLGDMRELGEESARYHREAGEWARELGVERMFSVGTLSEAEQRGLWTRRATLRKTRMRLLEDLRASLRRTSSCWSKGPAACAWSAWSSALVED